MIGRRDHFGFDFMAALIENCSVFINNHVTNLCVDALAPQKLFICEWTSGVLSCPMSTVLNIRSAIYGRTDKSRCSQVSVTNCKLNVTSLIRTKCGGKNHCSLKATNSLMGSDPCRTVPKYLEVDYTCEFGK